MNKTKQKKSLKYLEFIMFVFPWSKKNDSNTSLSKTNEKPRKIERDS